MEVFKVVEMECIEKFDMVFNEFEMVIGDFKLVNCCCDDEV